MTRPADRSRQLLVECSEPGVVMASADSIEHALRHIGWEDVLRLRDKLAELADEMGADYARLWHDFRIEQPNDSAWSTRLPAFSNRVDTSREAEQRTEELASEAAKRGLGRFAVGATMLMDEGVIHPETREQYIEELAMAVERRFASAPLRAEEPASVRVVDLPERGEGGTTLGYEPTFRLLCHPIPLPKRIRDHRMELVRELAGGTLEARARESRVGRAWVESTLKNLQKPVEEIASRIEAVIDYELARVRPEELPLEEALRWLALAVRSWRDIDRFYAPVETSMRHPSEKACLAHLLAMENEGDGRVEQFMCRKLEAAIAEAESVYTSDGVAALRKVLADTRKVDGEPCGGVYRRD